MLNRRNFLKGAGAAAVGTLVLPKLASAFPAAKGHPIGVQLFTFFNTMDADVPGTLKKIAAIGYTEVESAYSKKGPFYGETPKGFAKLCKSEGVTWKSQHVLGAPFKLPKGAKMPVGKDGKPMSLPAHMLNLKEDMKSIVDSAAEGGVEYLVCANIPTGTLDELKDSIEILNKTGELAKKAGVQLCYHNHDMEFVNVGGKIPYHVMLEECHADLVKFELDLAWATKAKVNVPDLFAKHPGRFPLLHMKDISADFKTLEPVGSGVVPFKEILAHTATGGVKHYFVEHDMPPDAFASITQSYKNLRAMGL